MAIFLGLVFCSIGFALGIIVHALLVKPAKINGYILIDPKHNEQPRLIFNGYLDELEPGEVVRLVAKEKNKE